MKLCCIFLCCTLLFSAKLLAQEKLYSVDFKQAKIADIVADLEAKSKFHFYYDQNEVDNLTITVKVEQKSILSLLKIVFDNTGIFFTVYKDDIFLTNKYLNLEFAKDYNVDSIQTNQPISNVSIASTNQIEYVQEATTANKIYEIGIKTSEIKKGNAILSGYVLEPITGIAVIGAKVYIDDSKVETFTDQSGYYSFNLPRGVHTLIVSAAGKDDSKRNLVIYGDGKLNISVKEKILTLREVQVLSNKSSNVKSVEMGVNKLDIKVIRKIPSLFGEPDILRAVLTLPGVVSVGESSTGFNVRGGSADQNLILLNDATVYNASHFFGFFSAFNPDLVKDVQLYKSTIPEQYGGRLSSVLNVTNRDGDKDKITGSAGIGIITSRFNIEGPIDSGRTSFIFGGRATYSNWLLKLLPDAYKNSKAAFYDGNFGIHHIINPKNELSMSTYYSKDEFNLNSDTSYNYSNKNASLKWKHKFNDKLNVALTAAADFYDFNVQSDGNPVNAYNLGFKINQFNFKTDFVNYINRKHTIKYGISSIYYQLNPGSYVPIGTSSLVVADVLPEEQALESAVYLGDQFEITENFSINAGLRYTFYNFLGPQKVNNYAPGLPITTDNQIGTTAYGRNKLIKTYQGPEIRLSTRYNFTNDFSVKASYNTLRQYIHLLSNTTAISPTDVWKLSDPNIKPQYGTQISFGVYKNFTPRSLETSVEVYYKTLEDYLDYKSGASIILNRNIETDVVSTEGKAYGVELFVKKTEGKLTGWMSYAYSRTMLKMDDPKNGSLINEGNYYPASFDKPHAFNFTGNYAFKQRYSLSLNLTYSTGRPITLPVAKFYYAGSERVYYSERNAYRIPDYFRTDLSFNIEGNHKINQRFRNSFTMGIYNLTGRKNAYSTYFTKDNGSIRGYNLSIFAAALPFVSYNIKF